MPADGKGVNSVLTAELVTGEGVFGTNGSTIVGWPVDPTAILGSVVGGALNVTGSGTKGSTIVGWPVNPTAILGSVVGGALKVVKNGSATVGAAVNVSVMKT